MTSRVYAYLRASTKEQDAKRAKTMLKNFAKEHNLTIHAEFIENESGASLQRPELFRLLEVAQAGDVLLVEQVDRLSRLNAADWQTLRTTIQSKGVKVVALDLPTSYAMLSGNEFTDGMLQAINGMLLDMLAAIARKDYTDRRKRQAQGIAKAKAAGTYKGRRPDPKKAEQVRALFSAGKNKSEIFRITGIARTTINKILEDQ